MNKTRLQRWQYLLVDFAMTFLVWLIFVYWRREVLEGGGKLDQQQFINATVISLYWLMLYAMAGLYGNPFRRSRLQELIQVFKFSLIGVLVIFFLIFLDDPIPPSNPSLQRVLLTIYLGLQFGSVAILRFILTTRTQIRIRKGALTFPTLLVGCQAQAMGIYQELTGMRRSIGYEFKGFVSLPNYRENQFHGKLKHYGVVDRIEEIIRNRKIEEVIIALEPEEAHQVGYVIERCEGTQANIKVVPGVYDYIVGSVKSSHILGAPLIEVFPSIMKPWERIGKRVFDLVVSVSVLILLAPLYLVLGILIKLDSPGPVFFRQERVGKDGKPFRIIKFRSMYVDAE
ncbi:MAG: sugar transferase, partial [Bacteroidota bacterium]